MNNVLEQNLQIRKAFYHILKNTPKAELLKIPEGYNNNKNKLVNESTQKNLLTI